MNDESTAKQNTGKNDEKTPSKKKNKFFSYSLLIIAGLALAGGIILFASIALRGASSPEKAVAGYLKASMLYDTDGMIEYASDYQKRALYDGRETSDGVLKAYLDKFYADNSTDYTEEGISFTLLSVLEYDEDSQKYATALEKYGEKAEKDDISAVAAVTIQTIIDGKEQAAKSYVAVKIGLRWFYGYAGT